jgi:transposase InsO family protein
MQAQCVACTTRPKRTTPFACHRQRHPQTNGTVERFNGLVDRVTFHSTETGF